MTQLSEHRTTAASPHDSGRRWQPPPPLPESRPRRLLAALGLVLLIIGVPTALGFSIGWPLPHSIPALPEARTVLSAPLEWGLVLKVLAVVIWVAWAHFTVCVVTEVVVAVRARRAGHDRQTIRVPVGGFSQGLARRLVQASLVTATIAGSVAATGSYGTILTPARPAAASQPVAVVHSVSSATSSAVAPDPTPATAAATPSVGTHAAPPPHPEYVVQPPHGGYYDSLWDIADRFLRDGQRWREIYELNEGREQPGGRALTRPELIRPGWRLLLPRDATGLPASESDSRPATGWVPEPYTDTGPVPPAATPTPSRGVHEATVPTVAASPSTPSRPTQPSVRPSTESKVRAPAAVGPTSEPAPATEAPPQAVPSDDQDDSRFLPSEAVGGLLAAAALAGLAMVRHRQRRRRADGQSIPRPGAALAQAEGQLRVLAEPDDMTHVDEALRALTLAAAVEDPLPDVQFALVRAGRLDLALPDVWPDAPSPFVAQDGGLIWRAPALPRPLISPEDASRVPPLLPLLLTVGRDSEGLVMLDLEAVGALAVEGPETDVTEVLSHLVAEAALAPWADGVEVLLVGFDAELAQSLEQLDPDRVTAVDDLDASMLRVIGTRASRVEAAGDRLASRVQASRPDAQNEVRPPLLVVCAAPPEALPVLVPDDGRGGVVVVAPAPWAGAKVRWVLGGPLPVFGQAPSPVPCRLDRDRARSLAESLQFARAPVSVKVVPETVVAPSQGDGGKRLAAADSFTELRVPRPAVLRTHSEGSVATVGPDESADDGDALDDAVAAFLQGTAPATVGFIGPVTVNATGNLEPDRRSRLTEIVAYLAARRRGAAMADFDAAIWPDRPVTLKTRNQAITRARAWLGGDEEGISWLRPMTDGALRLSRQVLVDWELFQSLQERASERGRAPAAVRRDLETAMRLVRGRPLSQLPTGRYGWLAGTFLEQEVPSAAIDVAHRLARILLEEGNVQGVLEMAHLALEVDRYDERPWRDLLEAHHLRGEHRQVEALVDQLRELLEVELDDDLQPETAELIERLLPRRRPA